MWPPPRPSPVGGGGTPPPGGGREGGNGGEGAVAPTPALPRWGRGKVPPHPSPPPLGAALGEGGGGLHPGPPALGEGVRLPPEGGGREGGIHLAREGVMCRALCRRNVSLPLIVKRGEE